MNKAGESGPGSAVGNPSGKRPSLAILRRAAGGAGLGLGLAVAAGIWMVWPSARANRYVSEGLWNNLLVELLGEVRTAFPYAAPIGLAAPFLLWIFTARRRSIPTPRARTRIDRVARRLGDSFLALGALALVCFSAASVVLPLRLARAANGRPNIIVLCIDALRADHLGCYGYPRDTSPTIDSLAGRGVKFERAFSQGSSTRISISTLFTSLYPVRHGVFERGQILDPRFLTLAEWLREHGYRTAAFMPNPNLKRFLGFAQGFDHYDDDILFPSLESEPYGQGVLPEWRVHETAVKLQDRARTWLGKTGGDPFFLYIHYRDVHLPYVPPPPYDARYYSAEDEGRRREIRRSERERMIHSLRLPNDRNDLNYYVAQYDGEIRYTDDRIAEFLGYLEGAGILEKTILVITADHGEGFLDHGQWAHGSTLYEEEIHVPLIIVPPGGASRGEVVDDPVGLVDLAPTLLDLAGLPPLPTAQGRSVRALVDGGELPPRPILGEIREVKAVRTPEWKLLASASGKPLELFHLPDDPREETNLRGERKDVVRGLRAQLAGLLGKDARGGTERKARTADLDRDTIEQMKSLGYVR